MKIYSLPVVLSGRTKQSNNYHLQNKEATTTSGISDEILKKISYNDINFYGKKKLIKPNLTSETSKLFLSKMQILDKDIQQGGSFGPMPILTADEQVRTSWDITELKKIKYLLTLDKNQENKNIYTFVKQYKSPQGECVFESMRCILDKDGKMIHGTISTSNQFTHKYVLSFDRENKNLRRLTLGDIDGTTKYLPSSDSNIWSPIAAYSNDTRSVGYGLDGIKSVFKELFMELTQLNTSIKGV